MCTSYRYKFFFPNSLHQGFNVIFDLKFAYKRVLMFLSDWWVSFLLLLFLSNLSIVVKKKIGLVCSISFGVNRFPLQLKSIFAYV